jgi:solute carrier family 35 protein E1
MGTGLLLFIPMWIFKIRESPAQNFGQLIEVFGYMKSVAFFQTLTHISGVIALGSGAVSFTQVVKASEPVFTAVISAVFLKQYLAWQVYVSLLPICIGVAIASTTELSFSWYCLLAGIIANVFSAARGVFGKTQMCGETSCLEQLSPENYYAILTILSFSMLIPATFLVESNQISIMLKSAFSYFKNNIVSTGISQLSMSENIVSKFNFEGVLYTLFSGLLFYLYNEVSFRTLNKVHPVTHAISNTVKRVVIILSSVIVFNNKMTFNSIAGTVLSMAGVFVYSIAQYIYKPKTKKKN